MKKEKQNVKDLVFRLEQKQRRLTTLAVFITLPLDAITSNAVNWNWSWKKYVYIKAFTQMHCIETFHIVRKYD